LEPTETSPRIFTPAYYARLEEIEGTHWWYRGMRALTARWLSSASSGQTGLRVLDVGCGAGFMLRWLERSSTNANVVGLDFDPQALIYARHHGRGIVVHGSALGLPFGSAAFDLVNCADVLQHLPTATGGVEALSEIGRVLAPGGLLVVRTNATPGLGEAHGDAQYQRYRLTRLEEDVREAGLTVLRSTHVNVVGSLAGTLRRYRQGVHAGSHADHVTQHGPGLPRLSRIPGVNALMTGLMTAEAMLLSLDHISSPFGHSAMVLAVKH
jgi:SAM-dependent methyltransferase